jgi:hypothetical protein
MREIPVIDYERHPAYAGLAGASAGAPDAADELIDTIEDAYDSIMESGDTAEERVAAFDSKIAPLLEELSGVLSRSGGLRPSFAPHVANALKSASASLRKAAASRRPCAGQNSTSEGLSGEQIARLAALQRDGFFRYEPFGALAKRVLAGTVVERAVLRRRKAKRPRHHCTLALHPRAPAAVALRKAVEDNGVVELASRYLGRPVELRHMALDHAHTGQDWYKNCYADAGLASSKTTYLHLDADSDVIKAMIYLKDVGEGDAPFSFVAGSHTWKRSDVRLAVGLGFDREQSTMFPTTRDRLDFQEGYYRPLYASRDYRGDILSLPRKLRGSTHFGDDILDGSEVSNALLRDEVTFTGSAGTFILFDGSRGLHRGSMASTGARWAVQLAFVAKEPSPPLAPRWKAVWRPIYAQMHYVAHTCRNLVRLIADI